MVGKRINIQPERKATQRRKWVEYARRVVARNNKVARITPIWDWEYDGQKGAVEAWTRSEAKSLIKAVLGINKRLPKEVDLAPRTQ